MDAHLAGYGNQCGLFAPSLAEHYNIAVSSYYGLEGARLWWKGVPVFPGLGSGSYGNECLLDHANDWFEGDLRGGMVVTLMDVWVLNPEMARQLDMACWMPVDHEPVPPRVAAFLTQSNAVPIAMSRFGEGQLREAGFDPLYVPHGIDTEVYQPRDKAAAREKFGFPQDAFLCGMVAANKGSAPSRKGFQQALEAFKRFHETHDDAMLYLHTVMDGRFMQGENLRDMMATLKLPKGSVRSAVQYNAMYDPLPDSIMSELYSAFDVLLHPAMAEGFGIPLLEAGACGVPAVATNFSAIPEVAGPAAWLVGCREFWTGQEAMQVIADVDSVVDGLERAYGMSVAEASKRSEMCVEHAGGFAAPRVLVEHLLPALEKAQERFDGRRPVEVSAQVAA